MTILVEKSGLYASIRDSGRFGYRNLGVNPGGASDIAALRTVNLLLGNDEYEAAIETYFPAPVFLFETETSFAIGGGNFEPELDGMNIIMNSVIRAKAGSRLRFRRKVRGNISVISIKDGLYVPTILRSKSLNSAAGFGGFEGRTLQTGDRIRISGGIVSSAQIVGTIPTYVQNPVLRVLPGPDFKSITALGLLRFLEGGFEITRQSNRMGYRLFGKAITLLDDSERISSAVTYGTIQCLPDGGLTVLMADHQTTGGYPNLATVITADLPVLAQTSVGQTLRFEVADEFEAISALQMQERDFAFLKAGLKLNRK
ncbi:MAG: biotin-dependent carboxyltransferase family protein [Pyrinomonadaceae bacterium]